MSLPVTVINWLQLIRAPAGLSVISNSFIAHVIAVEGNIRLTDLMLTIIASLCLYFGGMVLNDCFDFQEDARDRPNRPLPSGAIQLHQAWMAGSILLLLGCLFAALINMQAFSIALILAGLIVIYNSNMLPAWPRAFVMGLCRYSNWLMALAVAPLTPQSYLLALPVLIYVVGLTRLSQVETTGLTRFHRVELILMLVFAMTLLTLIANWTLSSLLAMILLGTYFAMLVKPLLAQDCKAEVIQITVGKFIMGLIPLDIAIGLSAGNYWIVLLALLLLPLGKFLGKRIYIS